MVYKFIGLKRWTTDKKEDMTTHILAKVSDDYTKCNGCTGEIAKYTTARKYELTEALGTEYEVTFNQYGKICKMQEVFDDLPY